MISSANSIDDFFLELGHKVFKKNSANQRDIFNEEISKLRDDLLKKAKEEKEALLSEAREKAHEDLREAMEEAKKGQVQHGTYFNGKFRNGDLIKRFIAISWKKVTTLNNIQRK